MRSVDGFILVTSASTGINNTHKTHNTLLQILGYFQKHKIHIFNNVIAVVY